MDRTLVEFRGFTCCLDAAREKGDGSGTGVWETGEIDGKPVMLEAFETGGSV